MKLRLAVPQALLDFAEFAELRGLRREGRRQRPLRRRRCGQ
jgi:hypothetical protein